MRRTQIFINLKRFDVPRSLGGVCPSTDPAEWITEVVAETVDLGLGSSPDLAVTFFVPEALILPARAALANADEHLRAAISIGCQSVYRDDISPGTNFGAFTSHLPATAAANLGCTWALIGHSEERRDKLGVIEAFQHEASADASAHAAVDRLIGAEVSAALAAGLKVLLCVGENATQRHEAASVVERQIEIGIGANRRSVDEGNIVVSYEPVWAIGPGKTTPTGAEIGELAVQMKALFANRLDAPLTVVYGGGLRAENAASIGSQPAIDGGLVALTRFTGQIGFEPAGLAEIVRQFRSGGQSSVGLGEA